jgi:hypothetical protein
VIAVIRIDKASSIINNIILIFVDRLKYRHNYSPIEAYHRVNAIRIPKEEN